jgi:predicted RNA binding protein YcfA (HicA-like mRNA interferase family)
VPKFYSWRKVGKALNKLGLRAVRQRGSHIIFKGDGKTIPVPRDEEIGPGLIGAIAAELGISREEFEKLLD